MKIESIFYFHGIRIYASRIALEDLKLERIVVVYPGTRRYPLAERVEVVPLAVKDVKNDGVYPEHRPTQLQFSFNPAGSNWTATPARSPARKTARNR